MARAVLSVDDYKAKAGSELGISEWLDVPQQRIDQFAEATGDHQFIHVDPERAEATPFGTTIAHGFLTLSLVSRMAADVLPHIEGTKMGVNYGLNRLRFLAPVKSGKRIRAHFHLLEVSERGEGVLQATTSVTVEIEGEKKPALAAEWITLIYV